MAGIANGGWRNWLLGITATLMGSLIINGITFQRDVRQKIAENEVKITQLQIRDENIIKYLEQFSAERMKAVDAAIQRLEKRIELLEARR